jgi:hypothetical protein
MSITAGHRHRGDACDRATGTARWHNSTQRPCSLAGQRRKSPLPRRSELGMWAAVAKGTGMSPAAYRRCRPHALRSLCAARPAGRWRTRKPQPDHNRAARGYPPSSQTAAMGGGAAGPPTVHRMTGATGSHAVRRTACPARTLSAICPCTAGNSRTRMDTAGLRKAKSNSPRVRENPAHGLFPLVVAGVGFEPT